MRIPHHRQQHQAPVAYLQPVNNNGIINANTLSESAQIATVNSTISSSSPSLTLTSSTTGTRALRESSTITNYSSHLRNLNGNDNGNDNDNRSESSNTFTTGELIKPDDNVNLMLSSATINYNHALKYAKNQNRNQNHLTLNQNHRQNLNLLHQNLNQNQDNLNQRSAPGSFVPGRPTETLYNNLNQLNNRSFRHGTKTDATRTQNLIGNNGNDYVNKEDTTATAMQEVFEGNLNVLVAEEESTQIGQRIITPVSNISERLSRNRTEFELDSSTKDCDSEVEHESGATNENEDDILPSTEEKLQNIAIIEPNSEGVEYDDEEFEEDEVKVSENRIRPSSNKIDNTNVNDQTENRPVGSSSGDIKNPEPTPSNSLNKHSCRSQTTNSTKTNITTGAPSTENLNLNSIRLGGLGEGQNDISVELTRENFTKLDLDKNLQEQQQQHQHQQSVQLQDRHREHYNHPRATCPRSSYQRHQENSLSSNSAESSPDDSLMDDEDAFSETPSTCTSLDSPEPGHYPRGIINPNYPGFQHLAHTLSEHFVNHHLDQDDSDLSEFEVELSVESLDESFASYHHNNNMIDSTPNNNNDNELDKREDEDRNSKSAMDTSQDSIQDYHDHVNYNTSTDDMKDTRLSKELNLPEIQIYETDTKRQSSKKDNHLTKENCTLLQDKTISSTMMVLEELACDLDTYLKKFETVTDIKTLHSPALIEDATRNCPTPDILIKNDKKSCRKKPSPTSTSSENRPDLLRNVSPNSDCYLSDEKKLRIAVPDTIQIESKRQVTDKQDELNSYSITPVDIVGDFGREVEHEFGLIVSGYNSIGRFCGEESIAKDMSNTFDKMTDAALSNCKEEISVSSEISLSTRSLLQGMTTCDSTTCDLVKTSTPAASPLTDDPQKRPLEIANHACKQTFMEQSEESLPPASNASTPSTSGSSRSSLILSQNSDQANDEHRTSTVKLINENSNENSICNGPIVTATTTTTPPTIPAISESGTESEAARVDANEITNAPTSSTNASEKFIPTAIVKPKYQKPSYDERQLPPIGLAYCSDQAGSRAWYEQKPVKDAHPPTATATVAPTTNSAHSSESRSRKIHQLPVHIDRDRDRDRDRAAGKYPKKSIGRTLSSVLARTERLAGSGQNRKDSGSSTGSCVAIVTPRKKDKMENYTSFGGGVGEKRVIGGSASRNLIYEKNNNNNNSVIKCSKGNNNRKEHALNSASFEIYSIETALPVIDLEAIENHLKKAKEEERKRRNDREEIRRRLAMGAEDDYFSKIVNQDRPGRKPSLQSRLQNGMNLQICFMNEASSDTESPSSDSETCPKLSKSTSNSSNMSRYSSSSSAHNPYHSRPLSVNIVNNNINTITNNNHTMANNKKFNNQMNRPSTLSLGPPVSDEDAEADFFTKQARLQIEARMALAQAKDMAHMQMEIERQKQKVSPITEVIRSSMEKVGVPFPPEKRRVSRQMLTDMNIAQLQIIVNDLHTQIERLNEQLVQFLMERDDLHMGQDSMLVDIEDLTRYLKANRGAKEQSKLNEKTSSTTTETPSDFTNQNQQTTTINNSTANQQNGGVQSQSKFLRIANLVKK